MKKWWQRCKSFIRTPEFYIVVLILIGVISHLQWFNPFSVLMFGDWQYRPDAHVRQLLTAWNTWTPFEGFGGVNILMSGFPFRGISWSVITRLGFTYDIATKLTLFIPIAIGGFVAPFILGRHFFKSKLVAFAVALFYGSTTYFLIIQTAHLPIGIVYALLPILVYFFDRALDENKLHHWLWLTLLFSVGIFYEVRIMYIVAFILAVYFLFFILTHRVHIKYYIKPAVISLLLLVLINIFWLLPTKIAGTESIGEVADRGLFGDALFTISQSLTLMKWNWTGGLVDRTFTPQDVQLYLWIVPALALLGLVIAQRYRKRILFFLIITIIGLLLTKQSSEPFASTYTWLYEHFPGFVLFREASKFYVMVAFGYFGLLGYTLLALREEKLAIIRRIPVGYYVGIAALLLVAVINLKPAITTEMGGTFKSAAMPADYHTLNRFLGSQPEYFRIFWLPRESWWGFYDNNHPKVRAVDVLGKEWSDMLAENTMGGRYDTSREVIRLLQQPYSANLLATASVKYVVVPQRDLANDDDFFPSYGDDRSYFTDELDKISFLRRIDIGTREVTVYENQNFRPYVSATDRIYQVPAEAELAKTLPLAFDYLGSDFVQLAEGQQPRFDLTGLGAVAPLFYLKKDAPQTQLAEEKRELPANTSLYVDRAVRNIAFAISDGVFSFYEKPESGLHLDGQAIAATPLRQLESVEIDPQSDYYLRFGDQLEPVALDQSGQDMGEVQGGITLYRATTPNVLANASFEEGLWQEKVGDCNNYDRFPDLAMAVAEGEAPHGQRVLQLRANSHTACTGQEVAVTGATYLLQFAYQNVGGQKVGYSVTFNDPAKTKVRGDVKVNDEDWHLLRRSITVPEGATTAWVSLEAFPDQDQLYDSITHFDDVRFSGLAIEADIATPAEAERYEKIALSEGSATFTYQDDAFEYKNLVANPSFEEGLWQEKVGDCHNYDNQPQIAMNLEKSGAYEGRQALQLEAARHIACTSVPQKIPVTGNTSYLLSFAAQSPNAKYASYYIQFDDPARTSMRKTVKLPDTGWHQHALTIKAPWGATQMSLVVYAIPKARSQENIIVRYDDFLVTQIPAIFNNKFSLVTAPAETKTPKSIDFENVGATKKMAYISGATAPFYLTMAEKYHPKWRVVMRDSRSTGPLDSWVPWAKPALASTEHFALETYQNAWYIDPAVICLEQAACQRNEDGSYNIQLIIEFTPQRWFLFGWLISGTTFVGLAIYLWHHRKQMKAKVRSKE